MKNEMTMRTALVRDVKGNLSVVRDDWYDTNKDFATDLRGNGYRVLKVWARSVSYSEVDDWYYYNRKS